MARLLGFYMEFDLIETGKIINTHALRGEVKIEVWANSAEDFCGFKRLFIDGTEHRVERARAQKGFVIAKLTGVNSIDEAERLKNKTVYVPREDIDLHVVRAVHEIARYIDQQFLHGGPPDQSTPAFLRSFLTVSVG